MATKITFFVKYGIPVIVLLLMLYVTFFVSNKGDAEFGSIGNADSTIILIVFIILLYLIAGIIVRAVAKTNFIFLSAFYSALVVFIMILATLGVKNIKRQKEAEKERNAELIKEQKDKFILDSLSKIIQKNPQDYKNVEKRALYYLNKDVVTDPEEYKKYINDLLLVIEQNSASYESYEKVSDYYVHQKKFDKAIEILKEFKAKSLKGEINISDNDIKQLELQMDYVKQKKQQYLTDMENRKKWLIQEKEKKQKLIHTITEKIEKEGYNSSFLVERGKAYKDLEKYEKALSDFEHAIKLDNKNRTALVQRAMVLEKLERNTDAVEAYKDLINRYPDNKAFWQEKIDNIKAKQNE